MKTLNRTAKRKINEIKIIVVLDIKEKPPINLSSPFLSVSAGPPGGGGDINSEASG